MTAMQSSTPQLRGLDASAISHLMERCQLAVKIAQQAGNGPLAQAYSEVLGWIEEAVQAAPHSTEKRAGALSAPLEVMMDEIRKITEGRRM